MINKKTYLIHRYIILIELVDNKDIKIKFVDHINGDKLNIRERKFKNCHT
jgi:hypothetical protein